MKSGIDIYTGNNPGSFETQAKRDKEFQKKMHKQHQEYNEGKIFIEVISYLLSKKTIREIPESKFKAENYPNCQFRRVIYKNGIKVPLNMNSAPIELKIGSTRIVGYILGDVFYATLYSTTKKGVEKVISKNYDIYVKVRTGQEYFKYNNKKINL